MVWGKHETHDLLTGFQGKETQAVQIHFAQSQMLGFDSLIREQDSTQMSEMFELSQDGGFQNRTPLKERFVEAPPSTVQTRGDDHILQTPTQADSPLMQRKGKLRRKASVLSEMAWDSEEQDDAVADTAVVKALQERMAQMAADEESWQAERDALRIECDEAREEQQRYRSDVMVRRA